MVDEVNGLRIRTGGGPEYAVFIRVGPTAGENANGSLDREHDYINFYVGSQLYELAQTFAIQYVEINKSFDRDFPGRRIELLDAVLPLLADFYFSERAPRVPVEPIPPNLREHLRYRDFYSNLRDR
jgi:hypothetical protein